LVDERKALGIEDRTLTTTAMAETERRQASIDPEIAGHDPISPIRQEKVDG
jgi:hypothetical protein